MHILGLDVGGTGIKGAIVDTDSGEFVTERHRILTPQPATPQAVADTINQIVSHFAWQGAIGCGFPAVVKHGIVCTATNIDDTWIDTPGEELIRHTTNCPVTMINDADAAGIAEVTFGAGKDISGLILVVTLGTGIGTALLINGQLVPNTELGHIELQGIDAETIAAAELRKSLSLKWDEWASRVNAYLLKMEFLLHPDLIIVGGGVSKKHEKFFPYLTLQTKIVAAQLLNRAGIVGAALAARRAMPT